MKRLYFITSNKGKFSEVKEKLKPINVEVIQKDIGYPEIQADSLQDVVGYAVTHLRKRFSHPFIIEDAGIFIDALQGFPGVYSKYIFYSIGLTGILKLLDGVEKRAALFKSVYAYSTPEREPLFFTGECSGRLTNMQKGTGGFGYDPIFIPKDESKTFAEMTIAEKNMFSHRGKALKQLISYFKKEELLR